MTTYTNIFGGSPINPAYSSYSKITLSANVTLQWPTAFQDTNNIVSQILDVTPTGNGFSITLPSAKLVSVGTSILFTNTSGVFSYTIRRNDNSLLQTMNPTNAFYIYLTDNTTDAGVWSILPFAGGATGGINTLTATPIGAGLTIMGSPVTGNAGALTFELSNTLKDFSGFTGVGLVVNTGVGFQSTSILGGTNISVTNGNGVAGSPTISLSTLTSLEIGNVIISANNITTDAPGIDLNITPTGFVNFGSQRIKSNQVLKAAGNISGLGVVNSSFGVASVVHVGTGTYQIDFTGNPIGTISYVSGTCFSDANNYLFCITGASVFPTLNIQTVRISDNTLQNAAFCFFAA